MKTSTAFSPPSSGPRTVSMAACIQDLSHLAASTWPSSSTSRRSSSCTEELRTVSACLEAFLEVRESHVQDIAGRALDGCVQSICELWLRLVLVVGCHHSSPAESTPTFERGIGTVVTLPGIELRERTAKGLSVAVCLLLSQPLPGVLQDVLRVPL